MNCKYPNPEEIRQLLLLWKEAFGEYDGFWELFLETGCLPDHCRCITENGQVTAGLSWFDCSCGDEKIAYVYAVVTNPSHRGKGLCRKLMEDVHALLKTKGYASILLVPAEEGLRKMYRKLGYADCTTVSELDCTAGETAAEIRNISPEEYARLRRKLLPEKGVLQEGKNLSFLAAQARLFAGEDFLLAAYLESDRLHGMELLGNPAAAPGILRALGCKSGAFQIPGKGRPYAMLHKLKEDAAIPRYFGLAFE